MRPNSPYIMQQARESNCLEGTIQGSLVWPLITQIVTQVQIVDYCHRMYLCACVCAMFPLYASRLYLYFHSIIVFICV